MIEIEKALKLLTNYSVEFIIGGGVAATYFGSTYVTYDLDICYSQATSNLTKIVQALKSTHPSLRGAPEGLPFLFDEKTLKAGLNFTLKTDLGDIDLFGEFEGIGGYEQLSPSSIRTRIFGIKCFVLGLDSLIQTKKKAGRPKDLAVAIELEAIKELQKKNQKGDS